MTTVYEAAATLRLSTVLPARGRSSTAVSVPDGETPPGPVMHGPIEFAMD